MGLKVTMVEVSSYTVTVVCCTANRLKLVQEFIRLHLTQSPEIKLLIVENSSENTIYKTLISEFIDIPNLKIVWSDRSGLSYARNLAIELVDSDIIAFTDDDCRPSKFWANNLKNPATWGDGAAVGGRVLPEWPLNSDYVGGAKSLDASLALYDGGVLAKELDSQEYLVGANMAFMVKKIGEIRFDVKLGRQNGNLLSNEDTVFQDRFRANNHKIYYSPSIDVTHCVQDYRVKPQWFISRFAWQGVSDAVSNPGDANKWLKDAAHDTAQRIELKPLMEILFENSWDNLESRVELIRYLTFIGLTANLELERSSLNQIENFFHVPIRNEANTILFEFKDFHDFLITFIPQEMYSLKLCNYKPWEIPNHELRDIFQEILVLEKNYPHLKHIVITSADSLLNTMYFDNFRAFCEKTRLKIRIIIHRIPDERETLNLHRVSNFVACHAFSNSVIQYLNNRNIKAKYLHMPSRGTFYLDKKVKSGTLPEKFRVGIFGELRSPILVDFIENLVSSGVLKELNIEIFFFGGISSIQLEKRLKKISKKSGSTINVKNLRYYKDRFRIHSDLDYFYNLQLCKALLKLQIEEAKGGSAVVADAISLGLPVITLANTESAFSSGIFNRDYILGELSIEEFVRAVQLISIKRHDHEASIRQSLIANEEFISELFS